MSASTEAATISTSSLPRTIVVASIQCSSELGKINENMEKISLLCREAVCNSHGEVKFIVIPEMAISGYLSQDSLTNWHIAGRPIKAKAFPNTPLDPKLYAQSVPGPITDYFCQLAKELHVYITVPFLEGMAVEGSTEKESAEKNEEGEGRKENKEEKNMECGPAEESGGCPAVSTNAATSSSSSRSYYFNTVCLASPEGHLVGHYRKNFPWPHPEQSWATKGQHECCVDTPYGKVGLAICWDIHSILAKYEAHHIWALLYPIAWVGDPISWFRGELSKKLEEVNCPHYIIGANWSTDGVQPWEGAGGSTHFAPQGDLLASSNKKYGSTIIYSTILTQPFLDQKKIGSLNLQKYAEWTSELT